VSARQRWAFVAALGALALASSWNGVFNDFTYDDRAIVLENAVVHDLGNWWRFFTLPYWPTGRNPDGYRPLSILMFSIEWAVGNGRPWIFHAVNIGLYAAVTVAVFFLAESCLPFAAAAIATALFAVHPVHVEAVANVVGQSELLVALFVIPAVTLYVRRRNAGALDGKSMAAIAGLYLCACLCKEHGIVLPALLLAAELTIVTDVTPLRARLAALRPFGLSLAAVAVGFLWAHTRVNAGVASGFHPYPPFSHLGIGPAGRIFTMLGMVPVWAQLFLWPARLIPDYGPPAFPVVSDFQTYQIPGLIILFALLAVGVSAWKKEPAVAFGVWFLVITLLPTSNFLVPSGLLLAERTLFLPSVGVVIVIGRAFSSLYLGLRATPSRVAAVAALLAILMLGAWRSTTRTGDWKDNDTLLRRAIVDAPSVYRSHYLLAAWEMEQKRWTAAEREYQFAIALYDEDPNVFYQLGDEYLRAGMYGPATAMFRRTLNVDSTKVEARVRLAMSLAGLGRLAEAKREAAVALREQTVSVKAMLRVLRMQPPGSR
jgi:hypothetical protein